MGRGRAALMINVGSIASRVKTSIGGIAIGTAGASGIYTGYTLAAGDDFDGPLDIVSYTRPLAKYFTTHIYGAGARSIADLLTRSFDIDPYFSGAQDVNKNTPFVADTTTQNNGALSLKARIATAGEKALINNRDIVSAMIHTGGHITVSPPCIIEARLSLTSLNPEGWHPTFWIMNSNPLSNPRIGSPGWIELDFPENSSAQTQASVNVWGTPGGGWGNNITALTPAQGSGYKLYSIVITASNVLFYIDGVLVKTEAKNGTITGNPFYILITNHTFNALFGGDTTVDVPAWTTKGAAGATMTVDYFRAWIPNANYPSQVVKPLNVRPLGQRYDFGSPINYTFPSNVQLWGSAINDYPQSVRKEDFEPGSNTETLGDYRAAFPDGMTWNSGTRNLSGIPTFKSPGRLHLSVLPNVVGGVNYAWRDYIDIGPTSDREFYNFINGQNVSLDIYHDLNVGTLLPKTITVGDLPPGLTFDGISTISGTPNTVGTTASSIGVTNASGQTYSKSISCYVLSSATGLAIDASTTGTNVAASQTISLTTTTSDQLIVLNIVSTSNSARVSSITASGLVFVKRGGFPWVANAIGVVETWYALAKSAFSGNITVNYTTSCANRIAAYSVIGCDLNYPFDPSNGTCPSFRQFIGTGNSIAPLNTITTTRTKTMLISQARTIASATSFTVPAGFTSIAGASSAAQAVAYQIFSSTQSGLSPQWSWTTGAQDNVGYWDVLVGQ